MNRRVDAYPAPSPLYSLRVAVSAYRCSTVEVIAAGFGERVAIVERHDEPHIGARQFVLHTDGEATLLRLRRRLTGRLGDDLIDLRDPVLARAQRGKLAQRVTIPLSRTDDLALIHPHADARVRAHLADHPGAVDRYTGRRRRVALVSDASGLPKGTDPAAALVGLESVAVFLHHHSSLDITPLPVDTRPDRLPDTVAALTPGFAAVCLHHTRPEHVDAVRHRLSHLRPRVPVLDTGDDATAVTLVAALLNALQQASTQLAASRVLVVDAHTAPEIGALLTAAGARDLSFADTRQAPPEEPDDLPVPDVLIDLSTTDTVAPAWGAGRDSPRITLTVSVDARRTGDAAVVATARPGDTNQLHPLLALPGLLIAAVHRRITIDATGRLAAAHAIAGLAAPGCLLPDPLDTRVAAAVNAAITAPLRPRRPQ